MFNGPEFDQSETHKTLRLLLLDFYRGDTLDEISLNGLEHIISISTDPNIEGLIRFRVYSVLMKKSGTRVPRIELEEMGPRLDLQLGRVQLPDSDMWKQATRVPKELKVLQIQSYNLIIMNVEDSMLYSNSSCLYN
jgi:ribosome production factor 2